MALRDHFFALFGVGAALGVFSAARFYMVSWLGERVTADVRNAVYAHVVEQKPGVLRVDADRRGAVAPDHRHDTRADGGRLQPVDGPAQHGDGHRRDADAGRHQPRRDDPGDGRAGAGGAALALLRPAGAQAQPRQPGPRGRLQRDRRRGAERDPRRAELHPGAARGRTFRPVDRKRLRHRGATHPAALDAGGLHHHRHLRRAAVGPVPGHPGRDQRRDQRRPPGPDGRLRGDPGQFGWRCCPRSTATCCAPPARPSG